MIITNPYHFYAIDVFSPLLKQDKYWSFFFMCTSKPEKVWYCSKIKIKQKFNRNKYFMFIYTDFWFSVNSINTYKIYIYKIFIDVLIHSHMCEYRLIYVAKHEFSLMLLIKVLCLKYLYPSNSFLLQEQSANRPKLWWWIEM